MRSKAPLAMMEQMVMILVFALAAALCLQAFVKSDQMSRESGERDRAAALCQSAAEAIRAGGGDFQRAAELLNANRQGSGNGGLTVFYGTDWRPAEAVSPGFYPSGYILGASRQDSGVPGLGKAAVWILEGKTGEELFRLEVCWQEVSAHG